MTAAGINVGSRILYKPERKRPLGGPRRRWESTMKMELQHDGVTMWTALFWFGVKINGWLLWKWQ